MKAKTLLTAIVILFTMVFIYQFYKTHKLKEKKRIVVVVHQTTINQPKLPQPKKYPIPGEKNIIWWLRFQGHPFTNFEKYKKCKNPKAKRDYEKDPVIIVIPPDQKDIYSEPEMYDKLTQHVRECDVNCIWTRDWNNKTLKYAADAFISPKYPVIDETIPFKKFCKNQKSVLFTGENLNKNDFKEKFDINIYSRSDGDAYVGYFGYNLLERPVKKKRNDILVSAYISNCDYRVSSDRLKIIKELKKYIKIDVFGKCFNVTEPKELMHLDYAKRKIENIANYKFHLAFENSKDNGYISEKIWQSFHAGTVPIYLGAPNIRNYLPKQNSALIVDEFPSIENLAEEIKRLGTNDKDYKDMFQWRQKVDDTFLIVQDYDCLRSSCKVCQTVADFLDRERVETMKPKEFHFYVRPLNMYRYKIIFPKQPMTLKSLMDDLYELFKNHQPRWLTCTTKNFRKYRDFNNVRVKIAKIVKSQGNYHQRIMEDGIDSNEKLKKLKSGEKLEVIFI
eukprot:gene3875-7089_t